MALVSGISDRTAAWGGAPTGADAASQAAAEAAAAQAQAAAQAPTGGVPRGSQLLPNNGVTQPWLAPSGEIFMVDAKTGAVTQHYTKEEADKLQADLAKRNSDEPFTPEAVGHSIRTAKTEVVDKTNLAGHPGISDADADAINKRLGDNLPGGGASDISDAIGDGLGGLGSFGAIGGLSEQSSGNIQAAIARQNAIADQQAAAAANYQSVSAPTVAGPGQIYAEFAQQQSPIQAAIAQAQQAEAAQVGQTALTPQQAAIQAEQIEAARIAAAQQAQAAQIAPTTVGPTSLANAAQINTGPQAEMRAAQTGLVSGLQNAIAGKEPSAAEIMLRNATDRNVANQYAMAQAANGMNTGLAQRTAMINAAEMNQNAVMQQALLRAQELTANRSQLAGLASDTRGADIGLATNQAGMQQQTNLANTGAQNTSTLTQAQLAAAQAQAQAQLTQGASQFNAGQANDVAAQQAQMQQAASLANQQANLQAGTQNASLAQQVALANSAAQNTTNQTNAQLQQAAGLQNAQLGTQTSIANAGNQTQAATSSAQLANAVQLANANNQSQANVAGAQLGTQAAIASANNQVSTNALNQKAQQDLTANQLTATGQAGQTSIGQGDLEAKLAAAEAQRQAALIGAAAAAGAKLLSDRREKTDVRNAEAEIAEFSKNLGPAYAWRYKDPKKPGAAPGQRYGTMVDELEKSAVGRSLVRDMGDGSKGVDVPQSIGVILATLSAMNKRIEARV